MRAPKTHVAQPVVGFRAWRLDGDAKLSSTYARARWSPLRNTAACLLGTAGMYDWLARDTGEHEAPQEACECGLHAFHSTERFRVWFNPHAPTTTIGDEWVLGAVLAWGRLAVHREGFRAEHARPVALAVYESASVEHADRVRLLAEEFGLPFVPLSELETAAAEHGRPVPAKLRPRRPSYRTPVWPFTLGFGLTVAFAVAGYWWSAFGIAAAMAFAVAVRTLGRLVLP